MAKKSKGKKKMSMDIYQCQTLIIFVAWTAVAIMVYYNYSCKLPAAGSSGCLVKLLNSIFQPLLSCFGFGSKSFVGTILSYIPMSCMICKALPWIFGSLAIFMTTKNCMLVGAAGVVVYFLLRHCFGIGLSINDRVLRQVANHLRSPPAPPGVVKNTAICIAKSTSYGTLNNMSGTGGSCASASAPQTNLASTLQNSLGMGGSAEPDSCGKSLRSSQVFSTGGTTDRGPSNLCPTGYCPPGCKFGPPISFTMTNGPRTAMNPPTTGYGGQQTSGTTGYGQTTSGTTGFGQTTSGTTGYGQTTSGTTGYGQTTYPQSSTTGPSTQYMITPNPTTSSTTAGPSTQYMITPNTSGTTGYGQTTSGTTGYGQTTSGTTGYGPTTSGTTGYGQTTSGTTGYGQTTSGTTGYGPTTSGTTGYGQTTSGTTGYGQTTSGTTGRGPTGYSQATYPPYFSATTGTTGPSTQYHINPTNRGPPRNIPSDQQQKPQETGLKYEQGSNVRPMAPSILRGPPPGMPLPEGLTEEQKRNAIRITLNKDPNQGHRPLNN